jgi:predicted dehydrogenase
MNMLRVAIIGCGRIADAHAAEIQRINGCEIVGVCDCEPLMAKQLADRFHVPQTFVEVADLLEQVHPDVVHITTPPESHFPLAKSCLERGIHVYVEKPFTLNFVEANTLVETVNDRGLKLTVGHDDQFRHVARRMRALVGAGYLGTPVHMEAFYCYNLDDPTYAKALLGHSRHWVRRLPGKLLHNIISHGIARIAEYLTSDSQRVIAHGFVSPLLKSIGETDIVDELRVIISEDERTTAYFTFSSQMRPSIREFRIYGAKNGLLMDPDHETLIKLPGARYKSYTETFLPPVQFARQHLANLATNVTTFLKRDFHMKAGMKFLIESFYRSISEGTPVPIPYREILLTARLMDSIFGQLTMNRQITQVERDVIFR